MRIRAWVLCAPAPGVSSRKSFGCTSSVVFACGMRKEQICTRLSIARLRSDLLEFPTGSLSVIRVFQTDKLQMSKLTRFSFHGCYFGGFANPWTSPRSTANQAAKEVAARSTETYSRAVAGTMALGHRTYLLLVANLPGKIGR